VLDLQLFGSPAAHEHDDHQHVPLTKPALLLFYLAYYGQWMTREELAFFFRPEADESTARSYVRKLLNSAKKMPWAKELEVESERLRWQVDTDVARFLHAFDSGRWYEAIEYYDGEFLKGVADVGLLSYDAWVDTEREALANKWHTAVLNYANDLEASGQHLAASEAVRRILVQDEFAEDALRIYIKNLYLGGRREQALKEGDAFRALLERELGLEPDAETQRLLGQIDAAEPLARAVSSRKYGRRAEDKIDARKQATQHLQALLSDPNVGVSVVGDSEQQCTIVITLHDDVSTTYDMVMTLAESSLSAGEHVRALNLLSMVIPSRCDAQARAKYDMLWGSIKKDVPDEVLRLHQRMSA
jgi:DNA-binding SARP family transcriptional activator